MSRGVDYGIREHELHRFPTRRKVVDRGLKHADTDCPVHAEVLLPVGCSQTVTVHGRKSKGCLSHKVHLGSRTPGILAKHCLGCPGV